MGLQIPGLIVNKVAEAAINPFRIVKFGSADKYVAQAAANSDLLIGVVVTTHPDVAFVAEERVDIVFSGITEVCYGGVVTRGDKLTSDANGKAVKLTDTMLEAGACEMIGIALESGVSGDIGSVFVMQQKVSKFDAVTASAAELNLIDGSVVGNTAASKAAMLDADKKLRTNAKVGTANAGTTAVEYGDGHHHTTVLTVNTTLPAIAGGANLAVGKLLYTFPAGALVVKSAYMSLAITQTQGNITADTPDGGLGTTIASGVVALLGGTPAFENILTGQTFNDCNGTAEVKTVADQVLVIEAGAAHTVHFNVADGWAASGDAAAVLAGTVVIEWEFMA
jgi:hypothetical protein